MGVHRLTDALRSKRNSTLHVDCDMGGEIEFGTLRWVFLKIKIKDLRGEFIARVLK